MTDEPELVWVELLTNGMDLKAGARLQMPKEFADRMAAEGAAKIVEGPADA